jgi:hypothetical protein
MGSCPASAFPAPRPERRGVLLWAGGGFMQFGSTDRCSLEDDGHQFGLRRRVPIVG